MSKVRIAALCAISLLVAAGADHASAAGRGGGGRAFAHGGHGGHGYWHGHGHGYWRGGVWIGAGFYGWPYYGYPYPYYAPAYVAPAYVEPPVYIQQDPAPPATAYWYFCPDSRQYYPSVQSCPSQWQRVPPTPPPGSG